MTNEQLVKLGNAFAEGLYEGLVNNSTEVNRENDDLIRRQDVLALAKEITLQNGCKHRCIDATMIHELPSAQKTGKWIAGREIGRTMLGDCIIEIQYDGWTCSECHCLYEKSTKPTYKFCPNCGCRMVEHQESEDKE